MSANYELKTTIEREQLNNERLIDSKNREIEALVKELEELKKTTE